MAYSTLADLKNQIDEEILMQLTDDEGIGIVNEDRATRGISDADEEIDGYVGIRYEVPLSTVPAIIRKLSVDIAIYNLYCRRGDVVPEVRANRYKAGIKFLEQIAKGQLSLGAQDPEGSPPDSNAPKFSSDNPDRTFDRDKLKDF